jgi:tRNA 2-thiocytidine biosynthesis protein TtcA
VSRQRITAADLNATSPADVVRIDIRKKPDERQIPGSLRRDGSELESTDELPFTREQTVVLYCGSGNSCSRVAATLRARGFDAVSLDGGYKAWVDAEFPTEPRRSDSES